MALPLPLAISSSTSRIAGGFSENGAIAAFLKPVENQGTRNVSNSDHLLEARHSP
ncbi:hypothetical protein GGQ73_003187 [Rhizobium skierniewicense]|uniref:Uncharacterized protein n=1 Tax=Rhizobium skierniewicense TaxID=984260 RepID=A0A7W6CHH6_9HYPH|nr:hypothetical protein [Rhizobium skierniewicense]